LEFTIPVTIGIVSCRLHQVTGEEKLDPTVATVLGPCGVIPKEFSNVSCFNVDLPDAGRLSEINSDLVNAIYSEFAVSTRPRLVAYRGKYRWERRYRPDKTTKDPESLKEKTGRLRHGGVYLITGGTGGLGLALSKYLAENYQAKIILTQKSAFPEKSRWRTLHREGKLDP